MDVEGRLVDLTKYDFPIIDYDPTEKPRGIVTADEWNTIFTLLKYAVNYDSKALQEITSDLFTASQLSSTELGKDGSRLIGVDVIPGVTGNNVNLVLRNLKEQLDGVILGDIPDGSISSEKLGTNLNFTGDTLTFNKVNLLKETDIVTTESPDNTNTQVFGALALQELLANKQMKISMGSKEPDKNTPGNIYLQYIEEG